MAIKLEIEDYCHECVDFEADVTSPERIRSGKYDVIMTDTIVRCEYRNRCRAIKRYLENKMKPKEEPECETE